MRFSRLWEKLARREAARLMRARSHNTMPIKAIFFDVGYTLVDETRKWSEWADWLNVPRERFHEALHDVIARGEHHTRVFEILAPGFDLAKERTKRAAAGDPDVFDARDLYPRGTWGQIHCTWPEAARAHLTLNALAELPDALRART